MLFKKVVGEFPRIVHNLNSLLVRSSGLLHVQKDAVVFRPLNAILKQSVYGWPVPSPPHLAWNRATFSERGHPETRTDIGSVILKQSCLRCGIVWWDYCL
jgi:hypothetical protein